MSRLLGPLVEEGPQEARDILLLRLYNHVIVKWLLLQIRECIKVLGGMLADMFGSPLGEGLVLDSSRFEDILVDIFGSLFSLGLRQLFAIGLDGGELDRLRPPCVILYFQRVILRYALSLILNFEFHQIKEILKFELHDSKSVGFLKFGCLIPILVKRKNVGLLVERGSARVIVFRLAQR